MSHIGQYFFQTMACLFLSGIFWWTENFNIDEIKFVSFLNKRYFLYFKKSLPSSTLCSYSPMFFSKSFSDSRFYSLNSLVHLELMLEYGNRYSFSLYAYLVASSFVQNSCLSLLIWLCTIVQNKIIFYVQICIWTPFYSIGLSILKPVPQCWLL